MIVIAEYFTGRIQWRHLTVVGEDFDPFQIAPIASSPKGIKRLERAKRTKFSFGISSLINNGVRFDNHVDPVVLLSYSPPNEAPQNPCNDSQPVLDSSAKSEQPFISDESLKFIGKIIMKSRKRKKHPGSRSTNKNRQGMITYLP